MTALASLVAATPGARQPLRWLWRTNYIREGQHSHSLQMHYSGAHLCIKLAILPDLKQEDILELSLLHHRPLPGLQAVRAEEEEETQQQQLGDVPGLQPAGHLPWRGSGGRE